MKLFKNKKGSQLVEKIMMTAFAVAAGAAVIVYGAGVITQSKAVSPRIANNILEGPMVSLQTAVSTARLYGTENNDGGNVTVSDVKIRFGAKFPISTWDEIAAKHTISNYGVKLFKTKPENIATAPSVEQCFLEGKALADINKGSGTAPSDPDGGYYNFTVVINITKISSYDSIMCAAPYFIIDDEHYFLPERRESVRTLAASGDSDLSSAALNYLINVTE